MGMKAVAVNGLSKSGKPRCARPSSAGCAAEGTGWVR